jgi:hypothetical protein
MYKLTDNPIIIKSSLCLLVWRVRPTVRLGWRSESAKSLPYGFSTTNLLFGCC